MPLPSPTPPSPHQPGCPMLPPAPPTPPPFLWFLLSLFTFAMLAKCFAVLHGSQIRPSKSDNAGSGSTLACQLIPIVDCFKQIKGNRIWTEAQREMERGGRWGVVCMASYSYLALSPILTPSVLCAWITDKAQTKFSTGLLPFNVDPQLKVISTLCINTPG